MPFRLDVAKDRTTKSERWLRKGAYAPAEGFGHDSIRGKLERRKGGDVEERRDEKTK